MKKSDLKTGMKVITREGGEYIVFLGVEHNYDRRCDFLLNPEINSWDWIPLIDYSEEMLFLNKHNESLDIVRIYVPAHPYDIFYNHNGWQLVWEREEKSQAQIELEKLQSQIKELEKQAEILKKSL